MVSAETQLEALRRWRDASQSNAVTVIDWVLVDYILNRLEYPAGDYAPKTTSKQRTDALVWIKVTSGFPDIMRAILEDLQNAEAALKGGES